MDRRMARAAGVLCAISIVVVIAVQQNAVGNTAPRPLASTIAGLVTDGGGTPVAGLKVDLTSSGGTSASATTDGNGEFSFSNLSPGRYVVSVCNGADSVRVSLGGADVYVTLTASCAP
ncbi:MAG: carboxypeptidase regulatory-like domain-containing protein [Phycisphaerales bacterium]|nr:carboxypeptidase regulatory-like domain-containing protein [Phycisphaerales bacterium]